MACSGRVLWGVGRIAIIAFATFPIAEIEALADDARGPMACRGNLLAQVIVACPWGVT